MSPTLKPKFPSLVMYFKISVNPTFCKLPMHPVSLLDVQCSREKVVEIPRKWPLELHPRTKSSGYDSGFVCFLLLYTQFVCLMPRVQARGGGVRMVTMSPFFYLWCTPNFIKIQLKTQITIGRLSVLHFGDFKYIFDFVNCCGKPFFSFHHIRIHSWNSWRSFLIGIL